MKHFAVIQIRGLIKVPKTVKDTLLMMNLTRKNHCVIVDDRDTYKGMLQKAKDYITWGEITEDNVVKMISKRGRAAGDKRVTDDYVKDNSDYKSITEFAQAFMKFEAGVKDVKGLKPVFRLSPPTKGYRGTKKPWKAGGSLGYRGEAINELLEKMV
jgi:large subunit ribosomal protein L30